MISGIRDLRLYVSKLSQYSIYVYANEFIGEFEEVRIFFSPDTVGIYKKHKIGIVIRDIKYIKGLNENNVLLCMNNDYKYILCFNLKGGNYSE